MKNYVDTERNKEKEPELPIEEKLRMLRKWQLRAMITLIQEYKLSESSPDNKGE